MVGIVFFIIAGLQYTFLLTVFAGMQEHMKDVSSVWKGWDTSITKTITKPLFENVGGYLYLFIPLLTMGVINKEVNNGTIKLLYSSPVQPRDIVLGKFLGLLAFTGILMILLVLVLVTVFFSVNQPDYMSFVSAVLGLFLLAATYISIGLFISSLTHYQIVAGMITFLLFFILENMSNIWQQYDVVRDITWFLSLSGRIENFIGGLFTSRDLCYFLLIIGMFIGFSLVKMQGIYEKNGWKFSLPRYLIITTVVLLLGYLTSRPGYILYADLTREQTNTIHPVTQAELKKLGEDTLTVTLFVNLFDPSSGAGMPQNRNRYIWKFWEKYQRFHTAMKFNYVYYYDVTKSDSLIFTERYPGKGMAEVAEEFCESEDLSFSLFKTPREIRKMIDLEGEGKRLVMLLQYRDKSTFLRTFPSSEPWPDEVHVSASISRLLNGPVPQLVFTTGHFERNPFRFSERDYHSTTAMKISRVSMLNLGADIDTVNLERMEIPETTSVLVVADPRSSFSPVEMEKMERFLAGGGNIFFTAEPGKQHVLNPLLRSVGVQLDPGTIVRQDPNEMPHVLLTQLTDTGVFLAGERILYVMQKYPSRRFPVKLVGATAMSYQNSNGFRCEPLHYLPGSDGAWIENGTLVVDSAAPVFSSDEGDIKKTAYSTGVKLSRIVNNKEQRIIISGDADYLTPLRDNGGILGNSAYAWLLYNKFPKYVNGPVPRDTTMKIGANTARAIFIINIFVLPGIMLISGVIVLIRRSRK
jgi:ABC-2 type transport system permease protein